MFANNSHPLQLNAYEEYNRFLRDIHNKEHREELAATGKRIAEVMDERQSLLNTNEGESLSFDDF
jgi:GTP cyclohydrolase I